MKKILVSNGTTGFSGLTKAAHPQDYWQEAKKIWPFTLENVIIKVYEDNNLIFAEKINKSLTDYLK